MKNLIAIISIVICVNCAAGSSPSSHLRKRSLQTSAVDCSDPSITWDDCRSTPYCRIASVPGKSLFMGGICNKDEDCSPKMRTQTPSDQSITGVGLCQCYARSSIYPFDECEKQDDANYMCAIATCLSGACAGLRAYCTLPSPTPSLPIDNNLTLTKFVTDTYEEKIAVMPLSQCEGGCCTERECSDGLVCAPRNGSDPVQGCIGKDASDTSYCTRPPCALGHCIYKKQPVTATIEVILAYYFAQMKCCATKWSGVPSEFKGISKEEYCNQIGFDISNCPPEGPDDEQPVGATIEVILAYYFAQMKCCAAKWSWAVPSEFKGISKEEYCNQVGFDINKCPPEDPDDMDSDCSPKSMCWGGIDGCAECGPISHCYIFHYSKVWCCDAKNSGPPLWWLSLRPNGNANQFCNEVGFDITGC